MITLARARHADHDRAAEHRERGCRTRRSAPRRTPCRPGCKLARAEALAATPPCASSSWTRSTSAARCRRRQQLGGEPRRCERAVRRGRRRRRPRRRSSRSARAPRARRNAIVTATGGEQRVVQRPRPAVQPPTRPPRFTQIDISNPGGGACKTLPERTDALPAHCRQRPAARCACATRRLTPRTSPTRDSAEDRHAHSQIASRRDADRGADRHPDLLDRHPRA